MRLPYFDGNSVALYRQIQAWMVRANELDPR
jgi:hypothetical protein